MEFAATRSFEHVPSLARMAIRMWAWAAALRVLKRFVPLETLVRLMHREPRTPRRGSSTERSIESYIDMTGRFPYRPPSNCLERSLIAYRMLCEAAADPELVVGVRHGKDHDLRGHVWVTVAGRALGERADALAGYTPLVRFDANGERHAPSGSNALPSGMAFE